MSRVSNNNNLNLFIVVVLLVIQILFSSFSNLQIGTQSVSLLDILSLKVLELPVNVRMKISSHLHVYIMCADSTGGEQHICQRRRSSFRYLSPIYFEFSRFSGGSKLLSSPQCTSPIMGWRCKDKKSFWKSFHCELIIFIMPANVGIISQNRLVQIGSNCWESEIFGFWRLCYENWGGSPLPFIVAHKTFLTRNIVFEECHTFLLKTMSFMKKTMSFMKKTGRTWKNLSSFFEKIYR